MAASKIQDLYKKKKTNQLERDEKTALREFKIAEK